MYGNLSTKRRETIQVTRSEFKEIRCITRDINQTVLFCYTGGKKINFFFFFFPLKIYICTKKIETVEGSFVVFPSIKKNIVFL